MRGFAAVLLLLLAGPAWAQDGSITPPKLTRFVEAELPAGTISRDHRVRLLLTIDEAGVVTGAVLEQGVGEPWDTAAEMAAMGFEFEPARDGGKPIAVQVPFVYRFYSKRRGRFVEARQRRRILHPTPGYRLSGTVVEKGTRSPLAAIAVTLQATGSSKVVEAVTDDRGVFTAYGLPPGDVELSIQTGEHAEVTRTVRGVPGEAEDGPPPSSVQVYLDPVGFSEYRTVIKDKPRPRTATEVELGEEELKGVPATLGDPTRVVATLPGVARSPFGLGYYVVRGASFENTGFFIDGHPALFLYHLLGGPGVLNPELVGKLTFFPGGYPADYGRFATGAIVLDTKDPPDDRWHGDFSVDLLKASALFSIPFDDKKGSFTVSLRRSYYELLLPLFVDDFMLSYLDYTVRVSYDVSPDLRLLFYVLGAEDAVNQGGEPPQGGEEQTNDFGIGFHRILAQVDWDVRKDLTWWNSAAIEFDHTENQRTSEDDDTITANLDGYFVSLRHGIEWRAPDLTLRLGIDAILADIEADLSVPSLPPLGDPRPPVFDPVIISAVLGEPTYSIAPFLTLDLPMTEDIRIIPGIRVVMDWYADQAHWTADPRVAIRWKVADQWTVTAMGAMVHQLPPFFQTAEPFGDPSIPQVRGMQTSMGVEWDGPDGWEVKVEGFFNSLENMARPAQGVDIDTDAESFQRQLWTADMKGRARGGELLVRKRFGGRFHGWLSYTLSRAERLRPPADWTLFELDQTHILNLAWTVKLGADWSLGARFTLTSGNIVYPVVGSYYDADRDTYAPIFGEEPERLPVFHRLDIRLDKRWRFDTWILEGYLDIQNLYNASNPESRRYSFDYGFESEGASFPFLPTLGVRAVF